MIHKFPHYIHAWAHTDHYALSKGFINNGFDLFHPETLTSNKQFPSTDHPDQLSRRTSSDLPIVQYTVAIIMKAAGNEEPIVYRVLMLLLATLGLLYLFKSAYLFSENIIVSLLIPLVLLFSPVYLDYQIGFLPSMGAMSFLFVGVYYYMRYVKLNTTKDLIYTVLALSLATAIRTPFAIFLLAIIGHQSLLLFSKKSNIKTVLILSSGLVLPMAYFLYNQHLRAEYGSIFLGSPLYARNFDELKSNWFEACQNWHYHYFGKIQWIITIISLVSLLVLRLLKQSLHRQYIQLVDLSIVYGLGVLIYLVLMSRQLVHHDYYALDTFIPYLVLISTITLSVFSKEVKLPYFLSFVLLGLVVFNLNSDLEILKERRSPDYSQPYTQMYEDYSQMSSLLMKNSIHSDEEIQIWDPFAPNMPFLLSNSYGANLFKLEEDKIRESMDWPMEHIIVRSDVFYQQVSKIFPEVYNSTELIGSEGHLILLKKLDTPRKDQSIFDWMKINPALPIKYLGSPILEVPVSSDEEFANTFRDTITDQGYRLVQFNLTVSKKENPEALWHIHIHSEKEDLYNEYINIPLDEERLIREIILPTHSGIWYISSYLYNPNNNVISYSDFEVKYY